MPESRRRKIEFRKPATSARPAHDLVRYPLLAALLITVACRNASLAAAADEAFESSPRSHDAMPQATTKVREQAEALKSEQYAIATQLTKDFPNTFDAVRVMGFVHSSHGNLDEMFQCWQQCRELEPNRADVYDQLGRYALQTEKYQEAIAYWQQALKIKPELVGVYQNIGNALLNLGRAEQAVAALKREIGVAPLSSQAHYLLGESYLQLQDFANAKASYLEAVRLLPEHKHAYYGLVKVCSRLGQRDDAARFADEFQRLETAAAQSDLIVRREHDDLQEMRQRLAVTCTDAARVYLAHMDPQRAERLWTQAAALDPTNPTCRELLASLFVKQHKVREALRQFQELSQLNPQDVGHYQQIGFLQARLGNLAAAESAFTRVVELTPESAMGYRTLAKFYLNTNRQAGRAHQLAVTAVNLEPVADSYFVLGWADAKNGKFSEALAAAKKALELEPNNPMYRKLYVSIRNTKK
jgi:tetratricopeptide (TPR) repeat protein